MTASAAATPSLARHILSPCRQAGAPMEHQAALAGPDTAVAPPGDVHQRSAHEHERFPSPLATLS